MEAEVTPFPFVRLDLPYPPSVNHTWRRVGSRTLLSRTTRQYRSLVFWKVKSARPPVRRLEGRLALILDVHPPDRRRRDLDNLLKAVLDALEKAGVYRDDAQIDAIKVGRLDPVPLGRVIVHLTTLTPLAPSQPCSSAPTNPKRSAPSTSTSAPATTTPPS